MLEYLTPTGFELKALVIDGQVIDAGQLGAKQIDTALAELFGGQGQVPRARSRSETDGNRQGANARPVTLFHTSALYSSKH